MQPRTTRQRHAIRLALQEAGRPLLPAELLAHARQHVPSVGSATLYRTLNLLVEQGEVHTVHLPGEPARFEVARPGVHRHHFRCVVCAQVFDVHACPGNMDRLMPSGFRIQRHDLTLYGHCPSCAHAG